VVRRSGKNGTRLGKGQVVILRQYCATSSRSTEECISILPLSQCVFISEENNLLLIGTNPTKPGRRTALLLLLFFAECRLLWTRLICHLSIGRIPTISMVAQKSKRINLHRVDDGFVFPFFLPGMHARACLVYYQLNTKDCIALSH
jgi:hypothetical protein